MEIIIEVECIIFSIINNLGIKKEKAERKKKAVIKTLKQMKKELFEACNTISQFNYSGKLGTLKPNSEIIRQSFTRVKTNAMKKAMDYSEDYEEILTKENKEYFAVLSMAIYKIDRLKKLSKMTDDQLSFIPPICLDVRMENINKLLSLLIK